MRRVTLSLSEALSADIDALAHERQYRSRSEAVRDLVRDGLEQWRAETREGAYCVASLSYVVDRRVAALARRLIELQHAHHDLVASATVVRLDHYFSIESLILKGPTVAVRAFADRLRAERGVRSGMLNLLGVAPGDSHDGPHDHSHDGHAHFSPLI